MADVTVTSSTVKVGNTSTVVNRGTAAESISAGQPVYIDVGTASKLRKAAATGATQASAVGIALNAAESDQPVFYAASGVLKFDTASTLVKGTVYIVSANASGGRIAPAADLATGQFGTVLGIAFSDRDLRMGIIPSGVAK